MLTCHCSGEGLLVYACLYFLKTQLCVSSCMSGTDHSSGSLSKIPWCGSKILPLLMYARIDIYLHVRMYVRTYAYMCVASP